MPTRGTLSILILLAGFCSCSDPSSVSSSHREPNVILISIDTLRAGHLSCYGYERKTSPNIDRFAAEGVTYLQTFSQAPKTAPSHMTMMTSLYPEVHKVTNWEIGDKHLSGNALKRLNSDIPTLAEVLKKEGYATAAFVGGGNVDAILGFDKGFDSYLKTETRRSVAEPIAWIKNNSGKKFFLFFHTYVVHDPYLPPPPYNRKYDPDYDGNIMDLEPEPEEGKDDKEICAKFWKGVRRGHPRDMEFLKALYDGAINYMDQEMIGPLFETLVETGTYENSIIIFTSDHGEAFYEHANMRHDDLYQEVLHVPLIIRYPEVLPANRKVSHLARLIDLMPTVLDLLDMKPGILMQGQSLLPLLEGNKRNAFCYSMHREPLWDKDKKWRSIRTEDYSYIPYSYAMNKLAKSKEFLFLRRTDPEETVDSVSFYRDVAEKLNAVLSSMESTLEKTRFHGTSEEIRPDEATAEILERLGYVK